MVRVHYYYDNIGTYNTIYAIYVLQREVRMVVIQVHIRKCRLRMPIAEHLQVVLLSTIEYQGERMR